jgi:uncharacterized membrane protein YidH (DUF202 family)
MRSANTRPARAAERVSLAFLAAGVGTYAFAMLGMRRLERDAPVFDPARKVLFEGLATYHRLEWWSWVGLSLVAAGLAGACLATARTSWMRRAERREAHRLLTIPSDRAAG